MKKLMTLAVAIAVAVIPASLAFSETTADASAGANASVPDNFGITVLNGPINLGAVTPTAESAAVELDIVVRNNHNSDWWLTMGVEPIVRVGGGGQIPLGNMQYTFTPAGAGSKGTPVGTYAGVPAYDAGAGEGGWIYTADPAEFNGATGLGLVYKLLPVTESQISGSYSTVIHFRLHSSI